MYELRFKSFLRTFFILLVGIAASAGVSLYMNNPVDIPMPVYILGMLTVCLLFSSVFYSKATMGQTVQIALTGILMNGVCLGGVYVVNENYPLTEIVLKPNFVVEVNLFIIGIALLFSILAVASFIKIEKIVKVEEKVNEIAQEVIEKTEDKKEENSEEKEKVVSEALVEEPQKLSSESELGEDVVAFNPNPDEYKKPEIKKTEESKPKGDAPSTYEEIYSCKVDEEQQEDVYFEDTIEGDLIEEQSELKQVSLQDLKAELNGGLNEENILAEEEQSASFKSEEASQQEDTGGDFIPLNIRLTETQASNTEPESKGKIGSIGKLLVNDRDIENVIESTEDAPGGGLNNRTNVISTVSGDKIYEKFSELKKEFTCIQEMALIDNGGFVLASDFDDKQRAQITGALVAGTYHTLQNYIAQLQLDFPTRIFFETAQTNSFIFRASQEILFSSWDKDFQHIEYGPIKDIFDVDDIQNVDLTPYADIINIENISVTDVEGRLLNSISSGENTEHFAAVSSAIFENLKIFLMNLHLLKLSKIVVFTPQKVLTMAKSGDVVLSFLTNLEDYPKISEELLKMEEIY